MRRQRARADRSLAKGAGASHPAGGHFAPSKGAAPRPFLWARSAGVAALLTATIAQAGPDARLLTPAGLGPVRIGMSVAEAARALGAPLQPRAGDAHVSCWITRRADGRDAAIAYMVAGERIRRIDVRSPNGAGLPVRTPEGVGIGTAEALAQRAYGQRLRIVPHPYTGRDGGHYLIVTGPGGEGGLIFETYDGRVTDLRAGLRPELDYVEGCS